MFEQRDLSITRKMNIGRKVEIQKKSSAPINEFAYWTLKEFMYVFMYDVNIQLYLLDKIHYQTVY